MAALEKLLKNRGIFARESENAAAYLHLDNKPVVNAKLIRLGVCEPDESEHRLATRFEKIYEANGATTMRLDFLRLWDFRTKILKPIGCQ